MPTLIRKRRAASSALLLFRVLSFCFALVLSLEISMEVKKRLLLGATTVASGQRNLFFLAQAYSPTQLYRYSSKRVAPREQYQKRWISIKRTGTTRHTSPYNLRLWSTSSTEDSIRNTEQDDASHDTPVAAPTNTETSPNERASLLNQCLDAVLASSTSQELMEAALSSLRDPSAGYDPKFGRPALRAYRSFVYPKKPQDQDILQMEAAAKRTANQIDFLVKRQTSRQNEAVRNHDDPDSLGGGDGNSSKFPITLVLDNLRGSFNVGSIFRTAEACGVSKILTCGITPHPFGSGAEKVAKSALGADLLVPTAHFGTTFEALQSLKQLEPQEGLAQEPPFVVALETTAASELYTNLDYRPYYEPNIEKDDDTAPIQQNGRGIALILGNEVTGVDVELLAPLLTKEESSSRGVDETTALVDAIVELPTHGQKNSLNVAAVAPVILYEILRQWDTDSTTNQ